MATVMGKNILKVDPVAFGYDNLNLEGDDFREDDDFEWDQNDLDGRSFSTDFGEDFDTDSEEDFEDEVF